jgi:uncharacterized protein (TIGR03067 family)
MTLSLTGEFMSSKALSLALLFASFTSAAVWAEEPAIAGKWRIKSVTTGGKPSPGQVGCTYEFGKDALISFQYVGDEARPATGMVDFTAKPWTVDIELDDDRPAVGGSGPRVGIMELKGDVLTICVSSTARAGNPRPKEFESKKGQSYILIVLDRVKKKGK